MSGPTASLTAPTASDPRVEDAVLQPVEVYAGPSRPGVELQALGPEAHGAAGRVGESLRAHAGLVPAVGVQLDAVPRPAAEKLVDRDPERLALDVPQRRLDAADGAGEHRAAGIEGAAIHLLIVALDGEGVLPDDVAGKLPDGLLDGPRSPLQGGFAQAVDAAVCLYLDD